MFTLLYREKDSPPHCSLLELEINHTLTDDNNRNKIMKISFPCNSGNLKLKFDVFKINVRMKLKIITLKN